MNSRTRQYLGAAATIVAIGGFALATPAMAADPAPIEAGATATTPVTDVTDKKSLVGAKVKDNKGEAVGEVKGLQIGQDGKIASVEVEVGDKTVAVAADTLAYAKADHALISTKSKAEIEAGR